MTSLAVLASTLAFAAVTQVAQAPSASAAPVVTRGDACGANGTYGIVEYENGVNGAYRCVILVATGWTGGAYLTYTPPSAVAAIGYGFWYIEAGGGGGGALEVETGWDWGLSGANGDALQSNTTAVGGTTITYAIGKGGAGGFANGGGTFNGAGQAGGGAYVSGPTGSVGSTGAADGGAGGTYNSQSASKGSSPAYYCPDNRSYWPQYGKGGCGIAGYMRPANGFAGGDGALIVYYTPSNPSAPTNVDAQNAPTVGDLDISWTASSSTFARKYSVTATGSQLGDASGSCSTSAASGTVPTSCTIENLTPGATYTIVVTPQTALGANGTSATASGFQIESPPVNTTIPSFTGTPAFKSPGEVLTGNAGVWDDFGLAGANYTYLWQSQPGDADGNCSGAWSDAAGATKTTLNYTIVEGDVGNCLRLSVTGSNSNNPAWGSNTASSTASLQVTTQPAFTAQSPPEIADEGYFAGYTFAASGYRITYSIDNAAPLTGLPTGMSIDGSGALTGTPNIGTAGVYTYKVVATNDSGSASTETLTLTVSDSTPNQLTFRTQPVGDMPSGTALPTQPVLALEDSGGRLIAAPTSIQATVSAGGTLGGTTPVNTANGVVTYTDLTLAGLVDTDYTLDFCVFVSSACTAVTARSNTVQVTPGAVASLRIDTEPVAAVAAGDPLTTQPVLTVLDAQGNVVNDRSTTIVTTSVLSSNTSTAGGSVTGAQAAGLPTTTGVATFTNLAFGGTVGTAYKLKFTVGAISVLSQDVSNTQAGPAAKLSVQTQPTLTSSEVVGGAFATQPVVQILDAGDNLTTSTATVTATPSGGTLDGTTAVAGSSGVATFTDLTFAGLVSTNYTLTFTSPDLTAATSFAFQFSAGQFGPVSTVTTSITPTDPALPADGTSTTTLTVQAKDAGGNNLTTSQGVVVLTATSGSVSAVTDNNDGTYTATYTPPTSRGTGTATVSGTLAGVELAETATITLKTTQTITFAQPASVTLGTLPYQLTATASSGLPVTFSLGAGTTNSACTVGSDGRVTIRAVGACEILVDQAGDSVYWPATQVARTFQVTATTSTAPFITSVTEGNTTADVAFTAPGFDGGSSITNYEYSLDGGTNWTALSPADASSPITVSGLTNGTSYEVRLRAVNGVGPGIASEASPAFTPVASGGTTITIPTTTPSAPRASQAVQGTATSAVLSWRVPESDGGSSITGYTVTSSPAAACTASMDATAGTGTCTASSLTPGQTYVFTVRAVNAVGPGETTAIRYTVPGGGGGGGGGSGDSGSGGDAGSGSSGGSGSGGGGSSSGGDSGGSGGSGSSGGPRPPFPPSIPTPDGPSEEDSEEVLKKPSTGSISKLPTLPIVQGTGPMPGGSGQLGSGVRSNVDGVKVMPTSSAELAAALAAGNKVVMASGAAQVGYMTSRQITVAPSTMLQIVTALEPDDEQLTFRLWMQDRTGAWFRMGRTASIDGQVVFPVMQFDTPGTYQVIATSVQGPRAVDEDGNPVWGSTTIRTVVIVTPRQELGTKVCPNMIAFDQRSAKLSKKTKREIRKLAECLGAMPAIKVSGYVAQAIRPAAAKRMAYLRARNVRNYLRDLGYDGGAKIRTSIELRPAPCESTNNRCALVRLELGNERASERAAWDVLASPESEMTAPSVDPEAANVVDSNSVGPPIDTATSGAPPGAAADADPPLLT